MRHKSNNKTRPLFTLSLEMTRLVNETRLLLVPCFNLDIYGTSLQVVWANTKFLGCGMNYCPALSYFGLTYKGTLIVCNYDPT